MFCFDSPVTMEIRVEAAGTLFIALAWAVLAAAENLKPEAWVTIWEAMPSIVSLLKYPLAMPGAVVAAYLLVDLKVFEVHGLCLSCWVLIIPLCWNWDIDVKFENCYTDIWLAEILAGLLSRFLMSCWVFAVFAFLCSLTSLALVKLLNWRFSDFWNPTTTFEQEGDS